MAGRPAKYSPTVHAMIVESRRKLATITAAAANAGIGRTTIWRWMDKGKAGEEPYATLNADMQLAYDQGEAAMTQAVYDKALEDPRVGLHVLERVNRREWGRDPGPLIGITVNLNEADPSAVMREIVANLGLIAQAGGVPAHKFAEFDGLFSEVLDGELVQQPRLLVAPEEGEQRRGEADDLSEQISADKEGSGEAEEG